MNKLKEAIDIVKGELTPEQFLNLTVVNKYVLKVHNFYIVGLKDHKGQTINCKDVITASMRCEQTSGFYNGMVSVNLSFDTHTTSYEFQGLMREDYDWSSNGILAIDTIGETVKLICLKATSVCETVEPPECMDLPF